VIYVCPVCLKAVYVTLASPDDIPFMEQVQAGGLRCFVDGCEGNLFHHPVVEKAVAEDPEKYRVVHLSAEDLFRAVNGFGTPEETALANAGDVMTFLGPGSMIVDSSLGESGGRVALFRLTVETASGRVATLYLAAGRDPVIYKVVDHDEQAIRGPDGDPHQDRAQAGPGHPHVDGGSDGGDSVAGGVSGGEPHGVVPAVRSSA
jgi:hypothetical protein